VCLPFLSLVVLGAIDGANLMYVQQTLCNATYEGARRAVFAETPNDVLGPINDFLKSANLSKAKVTLTPGNPAGVAPGAPIAVAATVAVDSVTMLPASIFAGNTIRASCTMVRE
jgi:hypothetical protein